MDGRCDEYNVVNIFNELNDFKKISPCLIQKRYGLNEEMSSKICWKVLLLRNIEARNSAKSIER